jgi:DHA1 family bicyclomycin/chloramphenicol resistance-like MFS transporter
VCNFSETDKKRIEKRYGSKRFAFFLLMMNVVTSAAVSIYIPCLKVMTADLNTTSAMLQTSIITHLIGEFVGRFFCGPLIATYSVRKILLPALVLSIFGHLGCFMSNSIAMFLVMRFIQATGASVIYVASVGIINAEFKEDDKSSIIGILELYQPLAWILSPFVGSILHEIGSWRLSFLLLMTLQLIGLVVFFAYQDKNENNLRKKFSASKFFRDYKSVLRNSYFMIYALVPGLFSGGYMIFAANSPFMCSRIFSNSSVDIALFQAIPLMFYVLATFAYRSIVQNFGIKLSKRIGIGIYVVFGLYITLIIVEHVAWTANNLLALMCVQCVGSAFLVPVSVLKAIQSSGSIASVGASTVVVFRNIIMSLCIGISTKWSESITMIMGSVFMTVGTVLVLVLARRIIKIRFLRKHGKIL